MSFPDSVAALCFPTFGAVIGLGLGLLWRASQLAREAGLSWPAALQLLMKNLFGRD